MAARLAQKEEEWKNRSYFFAMWFRAVFKFRETAHTHRARSKWFSLVVKSAWYFFRISSPVAPSSFFEDSLTYKLLTRLICPEEWVTEITIMLKYFFTNKTSCCLPFLLEIWAFYFFHIQDCNILLEHEKAQCHTTYLHTHSLCDEWRWCFSSHFFLIFSITYNTCDMFHPGLVSLPVSSTG